MKGGVRAGRSGSGAAALEPGSVLVVWKLDRLGRSMLETVKIVLDLDRRGIGFRSLTESFDTKTALARRRRSTVDRHKVRAAR
jgi:DNA invertase Pin-like site-specific DNA recombinase